MVHALGEQVKWLSEGPERDVNDFHRLTHNKFKKTYFKRNPKDQKEIQVIRFFFNVFTGTPQQQVSNFHAAEPDKDWVEMTPEEESRLMRFKSLTNHNSIEETMRNIPVSTVEWEMLQVIAKKTRKQPKQVITDFINKTT